MQTGNGTMTLDMVCKHTLLSPCALRVYEAPQFGRAALCQSSSICLQHLYQVAAVDQ